MRKHLVILRSRPYRYPADAPACGLNRQGKSNNASHLRPFPPNGRRHADMTVIGKLSSDKHHQLRQTAPQKRTHGRSAWLTSNTGGAPSISPARKRLCVCASRRSANPAPTAALRQCPKQQTPSSAVSKANHPHSSLPGNHCCVIAALMPRAQHGG